MKKIIRYNPALSTVNMGDCIIGDAIAYELADVFRDAFVVDVSSHLPVSYVYTKLLKEADLKFVCGTNLLMGKLNRVFRQWDINILNAKALGPAILVGAGWWQYNNQPNAYTKAVYKRILSQDYLHSVRDEYTERMLRSMGFENVISTACPTMWRFTDEFCADVPHRKANAVVTTLTDYAQAPEDDSFMLDTLCREYDKVYVWLQGGGDHDYFTSLDFKGDIEIIPPSLAAYDAVLDMDDVEYVGTRLHGGIRALQHKKRTIILATDNRGLEIQKSYNLPAVARSGMRDDLRRMIHTDIATSITLPTENIRRWKAQFL